MSDKKEYRPLIRRPLLSEKEEIFRLFEKVIRHTFESEKIDMSPEGDLREEIADKNNALLDDFNSGGQKNHFLIAELQQDIVGTIALGSVNTMIKEHLADLEENAHELKCAYVLPEHQGAGIGGCLLQAALSEASHRNVSALYLDSGYRLAQGYWRKRFGPPLVDLTNYFGPETSYQIWKVNSPLRL